MLLLKILSAKLEIRKEKAQFIKAMDEAKSYNENCIQSTISIYKDIKKLRIKSYDEFFNMAIFSFLFFADLLVLYEKYSLANKKYDKTVLARFMALTILEHLDDINSLIGKSIKEFEVNKLVSFSPIFKQVNKDFSILIKKDHSYLKELRNKTTAHKTTDSLELSEYIYNLDTEGICNLCIDIIKLSRKLVTEEAKVVKEISKQINSR